jgi:transposase
MMGKPNQLEPKLFYHGISLEQRIPTEHPLRKIKQLVDFNFIRSKVADLYGSRGNESVDPAVILKLMFLLFYENVKSERALMSQISFRLDWLWMTKNLTVISVPRTRFSNSNNASVRKTVSFIRQNTKPACNAVTM